MRINKLQGKLLQVQSLKVSHNDEKELHQKIAYQNQPASPAVKGMTASEQSST